MHKIKQKDNGLMHSYIHNQKNSFRTYIDKTIILKNCIPGAEILPDLSNFRSKNLPLPEKYCTPLYVPS